MTPEKDEELVKKYPEIFKNRYESVKYHPIGFGIECADGWFDILDAACAEIQHHCNHVKARDGKDIQVVADQVKEKFGELRFYVHGGDEYTDGIVSMAERMSSRICEDCGKPGKLYTGGWWLTQCQDCRSKHLEARDRVNGAGI